VRLVLKESRSSIDFAVRARFPPYKLFNTATGIATSEDGSRTLYVDVSLKDDHVRNKVMGQIFTAIDGLELIKSPAVRLLIQTRVRTGGRS
jgi:hypothetical protein